MDSSSASSQTWRSWLVRLTVVRLASAVSGLSATYWATAHLSTDIGARFVGNSAAVANALEAVIAFLVGAYAVHVSDKAVRIISVICGIFGVATFLAPSLLLIWIQRSGDGLIAGLTTTAALGVVLGAAANKHNGPKMVVSFESVIILTFALGSVVTAWLWPQMGVRLLGLAGATYLLSALFRIRNRGESRSLGKWDASLFKHPILYGVAAIAASAAMWVSQVAFVLSGSKVQGQVFPGTFDKSGVAWIVVAYLAVLVIGLAGWGKLLTKWSYENGALLAVVGAMVSPMFLLAANNASVSEQVRVSLLALYLGAVLIQVGLVPSILSSVNSYLGGRASTGLASVFVLSTSIGSIIGPFLGGIAVSNWSFNGLCFVSVSMASLAFVSILLCRRITRSKAQTDQYETV